MSNIKFFRGTKEECANKEILDGQILFETDQDVNNKIYADVDSQRIPIGGTNEVDLKANENSKNPIANKAMCSFVGDSVNSAINTATSVSSYNTKKGYYPLDNADFVISCTCEDSSNIQVKKVTSDKSIDSVPLGTRIRVKFKGNKNSSSSDSSFYLNLNNMGNIAVVTSSKDEGWLSLKDFCNNYSSGMFIDFILSRDIGGNIVWVCNPIEIATYSAPYDWGAGYFPILYAPSTKMDLSNMFEFVNKQTFLEDINSYLTKTSEVSSIETKYCFRFGNLVVLSGIFTPSKTGTSIKCFKISNLFRPSKSVPIVCSTYSAGVGTEGTLTSEGSLLFNFSSISNTRFLCVYYIED